MGRASAQPRGPRFEVVYTGVGALGWLPDVHRWASVVAALLRPVLDAGLCIELYHEHDVTPSPTAWLERGDDGLYRFPRGMYPFPLCYSLRARAA